MQIKLIALDLDGTALRSNNTLSAAVAEAIEAAAAHGVGRLSPPAADPTAPCQRMCCA